MGLIQRCKSSFSDRDLINGSAYFAARRVKIVDSDADGMFCRVAGSQRTPYCVEIGFQLADEFEVLVVDCDCPRFEEAEICKHVVAVLYAADDKHLGDHVPGRGRLGIVTLDDADELQPDWDEPVDDDDDDDFGSTFPRGRSIRPLPSNVKSPKSRRKRQAPPKLPAWQKALAVVRQVEQELEGPSLSRSLVVPNKSVQVWYVVFRHAMEGGGLVVDFLQREPKQTGALGKLKPLKLTGTSDSQISDPVDRELLGLLVGNRAAPTSNYYSYYELPTYQRSTITPAMYEYLLPRLAATGRFAFAERPDADAEDLLPLVWDDAEPWRFRMQIELDEDAEAWRVTGHFERASEALPLESASLCLPSGLVLMGNCLARLDAAGSFAWLLQFGSYGPLVVPRAQEDAFVAQLWQLPNWPPLELPDELKFEKLEVEPKPQIAIKRPEGRFHSPPPLTAQVTFEYPENIVGFGDARPAIVDAKARRVVVRNLATERTRLVELAALGFKQSRVWHAKPGDLEISAKQMPTSVQALLASGWKVEAEGALFRTPGKFSMRVVSGVDWFELDAQCDFDGEQVGLPKILEALKHGQNYVTLGDGSRGMLPEEWLKKYAPLASMGEIEDEKLRFRPSQALLLDALLAAQPQANVDARFRQVREKLHAFAGVKPAKQPAGFVGTLRDYQQNGLGWLRFLQEFGFGGCLADDMGLGKTIQVLALLEQHRAQRTRAKDKAATRTSLAVVPKSLIHNWIDEATRFTPKLRVLNYTGLGRASQLPQLAEYDLVLTTYGTLRRDIVTLKDFEFKIAILDEAQAIKNAGSDSAKACRLISAEHRLAMTGTPVENHLGELWSLFEFLNPGMLGRAEAFKRFSAGTRAADGETLGLLAKALRPYLLRRTKEQVLSELPEKTEQTLYCELEGKQRKMYNELREHYRQLLTKRISDVGIKRAKIQVLEALLRLRQVACHPALVDKTLTKDSSAKLETLLEQLEQVLDEGHKALVFSQFTSLLSIVRKRLDEKKTRYEYLDGKTRDRKTCVEHFQNDPDCRLFLISLKAGGLGLNLTAADYVFILDPWWNPAVEAQAVDRAHRIGQTRSVTAYRLIATDTVEEKILQLQANKRELADAIISADNSVISSLTADDLQLLLS